MDVDTALSTRRSTRAFLPTDVPPEQLDEILAGAARAPSNSNTQPWRVHVVLGEAKDRLGDALCRAFDRGDAPEPEYLYQPDEWPEPLSSRRRAFGVGLYRDTLGIGSHAADARTAQHRRNYRFYDAPVGIVVTVERDAGPSGFVDAGAFIQSLMLVATQRGLATCAQAAFHNFAPIVRRELGLADRELLVCGIALGHPDPRHVVNTMRADRLAVSALATYHR